MKKHEKQAELDAIRDEVRKAYEADVGANVLTKIEKMRRKRADALERSLKPRRKPDDRQPALPGVDIGKQERR